MKKQLHICPNCSAGTATITNYSEDFTMVQEASCDQCGHTETCYPCRHRPQELERFEARWPKTPDPINVAKKKNSEKIMGMIREQMPKDAATDRVLSRVQFIGFDS